MYIIIVIVVSKCVCHLHNKELLFFTFLVFLAFFLNIVRNIVTTSLDLHVVVCVFINEIAADDPSKHVTFVKSEITANKGPGDE